LEGFELSLLLDLLFIAQLDTGKVIGKLNESVFFKEGRGVLGWVRVARFFSC
jgi:hypothetical protein